MIAAGGGRSRFSPACQPANGAEASALRIGALRRLTTIAAERGT